MHSYTAYGLDIVSEVPLPELIEASATNSSSTSRSNSYSTLEIHVAPIDRGLPGFASHSSHVWATSDQAFISYPGIAAFLIERGRSITIDSCTGVDPRLVRLYLLGPALALALHQRGFLVLHGSAVRIDGQAVAFVGDKGMGKSTIAAALHARGRSLVADDLVVVDATCAVPNVFPGFPQLKLFPESAALLESAPHELPKIHPQLEKRSRRSAMGFDTGPLPLRAVYVLRDDGFNAIERLRGSHALMELVRHTYLLGFLESTCGGATHFQQVTALVSRVSVSNLHRRRSLDELQDVAALVESKLERVA